MKLRWLTFAIVGALLTPACGSPSGDLLARVRSEKRLRVGYIPYFDITFHDGRTGRTTGYLVDVLREVVADLGIPEDRIEFIETDWQNFGLGLQASTYDLSIAGTFNTPVRAKAVNFSRPIFYLGNGAIVRKSDDRFHGIDDFDREGLVVAVVQGEQGYEYAKQHLPKVTLHALSGADLTLAPLEVKLGKADAALSDQYILRRYVDKNPEVKDALADHPYDVLPVCWSVAKRPGDQSLLDYVNQRLDTLDRSGALKAITDRYPQIPFARKP